MRVLLDTQVLIVLASKGISAIPGKARQTISDPGTTRLISSISLVEFAIKTSMRRFESSPDFATRLIQGLLLDVLPFKTAHALQMYALPLHHREPFDRMLIAVAIAEAIPIVGGDQAFPFYKAQGLSVVWK
ncbi:MAG TPA: type II toxin-antitoxin system VapC family toxin [Bryobacteraceae bacterium]|nr:type II toxin-antitoxin system VapC family toxin [Bryobacteraceae bacterium]